MDHAGRKILTVKQLIIDKSFERKDIYCMLRCVQQNTTEMKIYGVDS
jgi:hypothetical protein